MNYLPPSNKMNNQVLVESRLGVHYDVLRNIYKNMDKLINIDTTLLQDDVLSTIANDLRGISWQSVINKDLGMVGVDNSNYSDIPVLRLIANNLNYLKDLVASGSGGSGLSPEQIQAIDSGITSTKVALYDSYDTSITSLQSDLEELEELVNDNIIDINSINTSLGIIDSTLVTITNHIANTTIHLSTQDRTKIDNTYTKSEVDTLLDGKSPTTHNHDSEYLGINDKASSASSADSADSVEWDNITDKPSSYTPSSHTHTKEEITNFPTIPSKTSDLTNDSGFITGVSWSEISGIPLTFTPSSHNHDDRYYTESEIDTKLSSKSDTTHNHDDRYYTETEVNNLLGGKSDTTHNHNSTYLGISAKAESSKSADSVAWNNVSGKPSTYTPSSHTHDDRYYTEAEIDTKLSSKANASDLSNYFPKSGGQLTGTVIHRSVDNSDLTLVGATSWDLGARLSLFGNNNTDLPGGFILDAGGYTPLVGRPYGSLTWRTKEVDTIEEQGDGYIRYSNGLQICFTEEYYNQVTSASAKQVTFQKSFMSSPRVLISGQSPSLYLEGWSATNCSVRATSDLTAYFSLIAIGLWK